MHCLSSDAFSKATYTIWLFTTWETLSTIFMQSLTSIIPKISTAQLPDRHFFR